MASGHTVYDWLRGADLGRYYPRFQTAGVTEESFLLVEPSEYRSLGIVSALDRRKLTNLIASLKEASANPSDVPEPVVAVGSAKKSKKRRSRGGDGGAPSGTPSSGSAAGAGGAGERVSYSQQFRQQSGNNGGGNQPIPEQDDGAVGGMRRRVSAGRAGDDATPSGGGGVRGRSPPERGGGGGGSKARESYPFSEPAGIVAVSYEEAVRERIRVCVRKRPLMDDEIADEQRDIVEVRGRRALAVHEPKVKVDMTKYVEEHEFIFDEVLSAAAGNAEVYARTAAPLIAHVFRGANATCFAYGQTGSGKTFTMLGNGDGIYILAARDIFKTLAARENAHLTVYVSFFEIYGGTLYDLLNDRAKLHAREDAKKVVRIQGLEERLVVSADEFVDVIEYGHTIRSTAATGVNADSSRSHAILQVTLRDESGGGQRKRSKGGGGGSGGRVHGKFSFIDLAGSERARDTTDNDRQRRIEGAEINKSLLALKECIRALDQAKSHTPFRQSKLTQVLKDSFIGDSRTVMIANINPSHASSEHTLNTLRYADRVKEIRRDKGAKENDPRGGRRGRGAGSRAAAGAGLAPAPAASGGRDGYSPADRGREAGRGRAPSGGESDGRDGRGRGGDGRRRGGRPTRNRRGEGSDDGSDVDDEAAVEELVSTHAELVSTILDKKEEVILAHRQQIDDMMELVKRELSLLSAVDQPGSDVDSYVTDLDAILATKIERIVELRESIATFKTQLNQEEHLSRSLDSSLRRLGRGRGGRERGGGGR